MANEPISGLPLNSSPSGACLVPIVDPANTSGAPTGTNERATITDILTSQNAVLLGGDLGGTAASPTVAKIQGTTVAAPSGGSSYYLNAAGTWSQPSGSGGGGAVPGMQVIWMDGLGADHTGATSVTSLFNQQLATAAGNPALFVFGVGAYLFGTAPNSLGKDQSVAGLGSAVTRFKWSGSGPLFTVTEPAVSGTWNGSDYAGSLAGFSIDGPYSTGGTAGVKYGALQGLRIDDVGFYGLDGSVVEGYQVTSGVDWAEEAVMTRLSVSECGATSKTLFAFATTSFDYTSIDAVVVVEANIDVVSVQSSAQLQGLKLALRGNLHGGTSNTGAVIAIERGTTGTGLVGNAVLAIGMEGDGTSAGGAGSVGHYAVWMGSTNSASQLSAGGVFSIFDAGAPDQGVSNANYLPVSLPPLSNIVADTSGNRMMADGDALVVYGGQAEIFGGGAASALYLDNLYLQFGSKSIFVLASGANALVFNGLAGLGRDIDLFIRQPASGAAGTVTWPSNVKWGSAGAPVLSTANSLVDWVRLVYIPPAPAGVTGGYVLGTLVTSGITL